MKFTKGVLKGIDEVAGDTRLTRSGEGLRVRDLTAEIRRLQGKKPRNKGKG